MREGDGAPDAGLLGDDVEERVGGEHLRAAEHGAQEVLGKVRGENGRLDAEGRQGRERPAASGLLEVDGRGRAGGGKRLSEHGRTGAARIRAEEVGGGHAAAVLRGPFDGRVPAGSKSAHGQAADVGRAEAALEALRERKPGRAHDDVDARGRGVGEGFELVAHRPAGVDRVACACGGGPEGLEHAACREVERRRAQKVDAEGPRAGAVGNDEAAREFDPGLCAAHAVGAHGVGLDGEGRNAGAAFDEAGDPLEVDASHHGNGRAGDGDEGGRELAGCVDDVVDDAAVVAEHGVHLGERRDEDGRGHRVPAGLVVRGVGRVAARGVVDDGHAAEFIEGACDARAVGRVGRHGALRVV